jgi:alpha-tubulin suppressor-like RCC1 family protein
VLAACADETTRPAERAPRAVADVRITSGTALSFRQISGGDRHTCGVTVDNVAYCWGGNFFGEVGDGTTSERLVPTRVAGGLAFRVVGSNGFHTCGITTTTTGARAYCWGLNDFGQLGDGTSGSIRTRPVAVLSP